MNQYMKSRILGYKSNVSVDSGLLRCDAVLLGKQLPVL
jgi:hypothetical protein